MLRINSCRRISVKQFVECDKRLRRQNHGRENFLFKPRRQIAQALSVNLVAHVVLVISDRHAQIAQGLNRLARTANVDRLVLACRVG